MERVENASVIGSIQSIGGSIASPKRRGSKNFTAPVADLPELDRAKKDAVGKKPKTSKLSPSSGKNRRHSSFKKVVDKAKKKAGVKKPKEQPIGGNDDDGEVLTQWLMSEEFFLQFMCSPQLGRPLGFGEISEKEASAIGHSSRSDVVRHRCTKLSVLPSDEGHFFFDDAAHGCAHIVLLESHGLLETLDHADGLREMLSSKTRRYTGQHGHDNSSDGSTPPIPAGSVMKTIPKGTGQMRQVVSLTGGGERDRERRRRALLHKQRADEENSKSKEDQGGIVIEEMTPKAYDRQKRMLQSVSTRAPVQY
jgi:hypothetical protein